MADLANRNTLQWTIRQQFIDGILEGRLAPNDTLPSVRSFAKHHGVARITIFQVYQGLAADGFIYSRPRKGYFVAPQQEPSLAPRSSLSLAREVKPWIEKHLVAYPSHIDYVGRLGDRHRYPYHFLSRQLDTSLFPVPAWRECTRQSMARSEIQGWTMNEVDQDDPLLIEQIRRRMLARRGIAAREDEILVTGGAQEAIYIASQLLLRPGLVAGVEDPGYAGAKGAFQLSGASLRPLPVDAQGLIVDEGLNDCRLVYVTPGHQHPTTVAMSAERRRALLDAAEQHDFVVLEDDYEIELTHDVSPVPALKSIDTNGRVIYVGSVSKLLAHGLRLGYLVAPAAFAREARALRQMITRRTPLNNQRTFALFLVNGFYDALVRKVSVAYRYRRELVSDAIDRHFQDVRVTKTFGSFSFWVEVPDTDTRLLAEAALEKGVLIEHGYRYFMKMPPPRSFFRLGFGSIPPERIDAGVKILADSMGQLRWRNRSQAATPIQRGHRVNE